MFILILILLLILSVIFIIYYKNSKIEHFLNMPNYEYHDYTDIYNKLTNDEIKKDCYALNSDECLRCSKCGIGIKKNSASCYPGDVYGPLFDYGMDTWIYNNNYDRSIFNQDIISAYKPWNKDYKNIIADPIAMATLQ